jgi:hypothetical protein
MPERIEVPDEFPAVGDVSGEFVTGTVLNVDGDYLLA